MKLVGQGERVNGEASRRGEKTKKKRKRESGLVVDKVRRTANDSNSPIYHSPLSPGEEEEGRRGKRNLEFPNRATKYVRTRFNVNYEFELFFRTICFFDAVNFREIRVEKKKKSRGKFRCASCSNFKRTLVTDLIISIAVSSDRPTRDENV